VPQALRAAMQHAETLRADIDSKQSALNELRGNEQTIVTDQSRIRSNLMSVPRDSQLHTRYLSLLETQENQIATLHDQTADAEKQLDQARNALKAYLAGLTM
jgi:chaperonin cofactor prefoldin